MEVYHKGRLVTSFGSCKGAQVQVDNHIPMRVLTVNFSGEKVECLAFRFAHGFHTGPVVAGIVGIKKFAYDIWGDTVNTAQRMESVSEPGKINISGNTSAQAKDAFRLLPRGRIAVKSKGEVEMYYVEGVAEAATA